jgi:hypothetical protein
MRSARQCAVCAPSTSAFSPMGLVNVMRNLVFAPAERHDEHGLTRCGYHQPSFAS